MSDQVYSALRARILNGDVAPGDRLVELELARSLEVSQAPVRDALIRLGHDGLVVRSPRRGTYVATVDRTEAKKVYELRATLEEYSAREMCLVGTEAGFDQMAYWVAEMHHAAARNDLPALVEADMGFHRTLYNASDHRVLPRIWPMLENTMRAFTAVSNRVFFQTLEEIAATHDPLLDALRQRESDRAATLFREHVEFIWAEIENPAATERPRGKLRRG